MPDQNSMTTRTRTIDGNITGVITVGTPGRHPHFRTLPASPRGPEFVSSQSHEGMLVHAVKVEGSHTRTPTSGDRNPHGVLGPWHVPVSEYEQWLGLLSDEDDTMDCFVGLGILPWQFEASILDDVRFWTSRHLHSALAAFSDLGVGQNEAELRALFAVMPTDARSRTMASSLYQEAITTATTVMLIQDRLGSDHWYSECQVISDMMSGWTVMMTRSQCLLDLDLFPDHNGAVLEMSGSARATQQWMDALERIIKIRVLAREGLSDSSLMLLSLSILSKSDRELEGHDRSWGRWSGPVVDGLDITLDVVPLLDSDDVVQKFCDIINRIEVNQCLAVPQDQVVEMIKSGSPEKWVLAASIRTLSEADLSLHQ